MPGITGIIRKAPYESIDRDLTTMVEAMRHETFYAGGEYVNRELGLYLGWMGQNEGHDSLRPALSHNKDVVLILHGETYHDEEKAGAVCQSDVDTRRSAGMHALDLYLKLGVNFVRRLNGWFSGLLVDCRTKKIILFNDRYGMGRLYFYESREEFLFGSEAKSVLKVRPAVRKIEPAALAQYLRANCVMGDRTIFEGLFLVPHAACWVFEAGAPLRKRRYFTFDEWEQLTNADASEFYPKFAETVSRVFPMYLKASEKVAMSLTAGLDTRVIMAALHKGDRSFPCYTFGGVWGDTFDIRTARKIAATVGQPYDVIRIGKAFFRDFGKYAQRTVYISDGTHDAFGAHDLYFNEIARKIAPVRLTGKFGSEVVRIRKMIPWASFPRELLNGELKAVFDQALPLSSVSKTNNPLSKVISEEIPWYEYGRLAIEQSQVRLRTPYMDNELVELMFQAPTGLRAAGTLQADYVRERAPQLSVILTNLSRSGEHSRLVKEAFYLAFWSLFKLEYIYLFATPHWLTRIDRRLKVFKPERLFSGRQKFEGYRIWIKEHLSDFVQETLLAVQPEYASFFEKRLVERMVRRHVAGTHNYLNEINKVLSIELICLSLLKP